MIGLYKDNFEKSNLTKEQENCVNFDAGDLLIKGVAGSGKSYVILKRAIKLNNAKKNGETVAIFTYANSLAKYTDDLICAKAGDGAVTVSTVDSYCMSLYYKIFKRHFHLGKDDQYNDIITKTLEKHQKASQLNHRLYDVNISFFEDEFRWIREKCISTMKEYLNADRKGRGSQIRLGSKDKEFVWSLFAMFSKFARTERYKDWPDLYMELVLNLNRIPEDMKIDYILIDEAQDMTVGKLKVLKALSKKTLTIAADVAQKIYKTSFTWKEVGIDISGRSSKSLSKSFRSTRQIVELAEDLMENNRKNGASDDYTEAVLPEKEGKKPRLVKFNSRTEEDEYLTRLLKEYPLDREVIGVICRTRKEVFEMRKMLYRHGMESEIVDGKKKDEAKWSLLRPGIKLVVAHSSKGLEFERVIIPYLDDSEYPFKTYKVDENQMDEYLQTERCILYVAMTRARSTLTMLCVNADYSRFIDEFDLNHYEVVNV